MEAIGPIRLMPARRFDLLPLWAVAVVLLWGGGVAIATAMQHRAASDTSLCVLRSVTGLPCPTCGSTRAVLAMGRGDVVDAVAFNPFFTIGGALLALIVAGQFVFRKRPTIEMTAHARRALWGCLVVLFLMNWAYIIARDGPWS